MNRIVKDVYNGIITENPVFVMLLGMCPVLGVTTAAINGIGMGAATTFVLLGSNIVISLLRKAIPEQVRIPAYIVTIATFVTIVDLVMLATVPDLHEVLGIFIPLIVVNCIILQRAESFASKNSLGRSIADAVGMGVGFTLSITLLASVRELLGKGTLFGVEIIPGYPQVAVVTQAAGAFITLSALMALFTWYSARMKGGKRV